MQKFPHFSMAKALLAVLWHAKRADRRVFHNHVYVHDLCSDYPDSTYRSSLTRLVRAELVSRRDGVYTLTEVGQRAAHDAYIDAEIARYRPEAVWDGGWRLIFVDIPEKKRFHRDRIRKIVRRIGFRELQKSVWAYPYPVPSFLKGVLTHPEIKDHAQFVLADGVEDDRRLRNLFHLESHKKHR